VLASIAASVALVFQGVLDLPLFLALTGGGVAVAFVGFLDDRRQLSARIRLAAHLAAGSLGAHVAGGCSGVALRRYARVLWLAGLCGRARSALPGP
jgi:Fuc2NAc and GlcNAc transferase